MGQVISIRSIQQLTHNVHAFRTSKPAGYRFRPGQATELAINRPGWIQQKRPFTFTSLDDDPELEFIIKSYSDHPGVTNALLQLRPGDELLIDEPWGNISFQGNGCFIAGGAGITPFIAIFRSLAKKDLLSGNKLIFSNRTAADIILRDELSGLLKENAVFVLTNDHSDHGLLNGYIDEDFLRQQVADFSVPFYICGPEPMRQSIADILIRRGASAESIVFEK